MKYSFSLFILSCLLIACTKKEPMLAEKIVQEQLDAYNARDIDRFMELFSDDCVLLEYPGDKIIANGKESTRILYKNLFDNSPNLNSKLINRTVLGSKVFDHEYITGRMGQDITELLVIYEVKNEKIVRCMVVRK